MQKLSFDFSYYFLLFFDEFGEDVFVALGKMFLEDFTEAYGQEFDRQFLIADDDPFTGAINMAQAEVCRIESTDESKLTYLDFRAAELKVKPEERKYCKWFLNETVLNHIANIQDDNRKGIEIKRFDETTEGLEYGELFMQFRKRDGFLVTRPKKNMTLLKTAEE